MRRDLQLTRQDYYYDLELDAAGKVIGGEWYTRDHPDFLWTPPAGSRAVTRHEAAATGEWDSTQPLPESWRVAARAAARAAATQGRPRLQDNKVIEWLVKRTGESKESRPWDGRLSLVHVMVGVRKTDDELTRYVKTTTLIRRRSTFETSLAEDLAAKQDKMNTAEIRSEFYENMASI